MVKRLRHGPFTAVTWVRFPYGSPKRTGAQKCSCSFLSPVRAYENLHHLKSLAILGKGSDSRTKLSLRSGFVQQKCSCSFLSPVRAYENLHHQIRHELGKCSDSRTGHLKKDKIQHHYSVFLYANYKCNQHKNDYKSKIRRALMREIVQAV